MIKLDDFVRIKKYLPGFWTLVSFLILGADYITGPAIQFPILYFIPIGLSTWFNGLWWGWLYAVCMPLIRLYFSIFIWDNPEPLFQVAINDSILIIVFSGFVYLMDRISISKQALEKEVRMLTGILPICSFCKKIRNQDGDWERLEKYITTHSEAEFSHGMCPECAKKNYPDVFNK